MADGTVTLNKAYFETLLRRAQFHTSGVDYTTPVHLSTVTIPKADHDSLLTHSRQYANLRRNLYGGGIAEETLAILIKDDTSAAENGGTTKSSTVEETEDCGVFIIPHSIPSLQGASTQDYTYGRNANYTPRNGDSRPRDSNSFHNNTNCNDDFRFAHGGPSDGCYDEGSGNNDSQVKSSRPQFDKFAKRTVLLANLPEGVTHAEVADAVRGGMILDIYLRTHDRTASVSFLEEAQAQEFFRHVKRYDLYIGGKRIEIRWNDRHFILPVHVANKISIGATRNLVIRGYSPKHTEKAIRDDLEHIHNLVVIRVTFNGQNAYISTNSVHNAMFARTCMMSRATYKGLKIDWDDDECAAPLEKPQISYKENLICKKKKDTPVMNRFHLLNMDGTDDDSLEDDDHDTGGLTFQSAISPSTIGLVA